MEKETKVPFELSKNSEEFVSSLFLKIGKTIIEDQKNVDIQEEDEFGSLIRVNSQFDKKAQVMDAIYQLGNVLSIHLHPEDAVDEEVLTVSRLNDFLVEAQEIALKGGEINIIWVAAQINGLFYSMKNQAEREIPQMENLIMSAVNTDSEGTDKIIEDAGIDLNNLDLDVEETAKDIEKYISMFKGEEYDDDRKDHPKGSSK